MPIKTNGRHWMEELIKNAEANGDFADLPGKGKPLNLGDSDPLAGPEAQLYRTLKEAGFAPDWVELRKQIVATINWLREHPEDPKRLERITETNVLIGQHNRKVPTPTLTLPKLPTTFPD